MKNTFLIAATLILVTSCNKDKSSIDNTIYNCNSTIINTHPKAKKFDDFLKLKVSEGLPGISMLISTPEGIWTGASGVAEIPFQTPMKSCNIHKIGSSSKVFTATLIFQLYEKGLVNFEDPITKYIDESLIALVPNYQTVTIKHLLNHSSGIPDYLDIAYTLNYYDDLTRIWTDKEELSMVYDEDAEFPAGSKVNYSNTNYLLLGMIVKDLTKKSGKALHQENIFDIIGTNNSYFEDNGSLPKGLVKGYYDENGKGNFIDITNRSFARSSFAGGISSTVEDLYLFLKATWTTDILISSSTRELITTIDNTPYLNPDKFNYGGSDRVNKIEGIGLCWFLYDTDYGKCYGHDGGFDGRRSVMRYFPESETYVIYLINGSGESLKSLLRELKRNDFLQLIFE